MQQRISCPLNTQFESTSQPIVRAVTMRPDLRKMPIHHADLIDAISRYPGETTISDSFHALTKDGQEWFGIFEVLTSVLSNDIRWAIAVSNALNGSDALEFTSGIVITEVNKALSFHHTKVVTQSFKKGELQLLVNENLANLQRHFNVEFDRCEAFKSIKLSERDAHHIICLAIKEEIVSGRVAFEFLRVWRQPDWDYLKPRTFWSLFCLFSWFLNRLKAPVLIERTMALHEFFDEFARFKPKTTHWVQASLV